MTAGPFRWNWDAPLRIALEEKIMLLGGMVGTVFE